jgi:hypothetical protein
MISAWRLWKVLLLVKLITTTEKENQLKTTVATEISKIRRKFQNDRQSTPTKTIYISNIAELSCFPQIPQIFLKPNTLHLPLLSLPRSPSLLLRREIPATGEAIPPSLLSLSLRRKGSVHRRRRTSSLVKITIIRQKGYVSLSNSAFTSGRISIRSVVWHTIESGPGCQTPESTRVFLFLFFVKLLDLDRPIDPKLNIKGTAEYNRKKVESTRGRYSRLSPPPDPSQGDDLSPTWQPSSRAPIDTKRCSFCRSLVLFVWFVKRICKPRSVFLSSRRWT